jgi:hypothetical protein
MLACPDKYFAVGMMLSNVVEKLQRIRELARPGDGEMFGRIFNDSEHGEN